MGERVGMAEVSRSTSPAQPSPREATALQGGADTSPGVARLRALGQTASASPQSRATAALQRQGDAGTSPFLPDYGAGETPAWQDEQGVPEWAQEEYRAEAPRTLIASMTPDGKIGSVYFPGGSRIRTTHRSGPAKETHEGRDTFQFNLDYDQAREIYETRVLNAPVKTKDDVRAFHRWLSEALVGLTPDRMPPWIAKVEGPETAFDPTGGPIPEDRKLFEVFRTVGGRISGWHPSRGVAARLATNKQTISVLEAAIVHLETEGITEAKARNEAFYQFVVSRLPKLADVLRAPTEV
ncbi:MAG: hypothetical protein ACOCYE_03095 [Pseudomonadota bacterium]